MEEGRGELVSRYLVTGAAGFIGSRVAELLLAGGHEVVGVDNLNDAYDVRLKEWRLRRLRGQARFAFVRLDIGLRSAMAELRGRLSAGGQAPVEAVLNLAARAGVRQSLRDPWAYVDANVTGTLNLLELCREMGVGKVVLASSSSLYGAGNPLPFREDANTDGPLSPYAASKKAAEALCYSYHHLYGLDVTVFRYFTVFGPAGRPDMSPFRFVQWIWEGRPVLVYGDGRQSRDFTFVDDIARGTIAGLRPVGYEVINLGSDAPVVLMDALRLIEELTGKEARLRFEPLHPADMEATWADIGKAKRLLGWRPETGFREGMAALVEWYRGNRAWAREIATGG
jgi:nucleoside-diphosphate-sugar epimerase